ncbi:MAG: hypothetical protein JWN70_2579 [Planctomycetaceae bacterium]|nr:hypothetical protein [Planctomycetaceae bacterium]
MVDRTVKVNLIAQVNGYLTGMAKAAAATKATASEAEKLAAKKEAIGTLGRSLLTVGTLAAVGVGLAIKSFADFDAKMSQVQTLSHATGEEMDKLTDSALNLGQAIGFTAEQTADAEIELVKAGVSVKDIIGGALPGALSLAAAGQIDVADATEIATIALTQFKLQGKDVPHVADLLAAGADKALGSVGDLGEALKSGGLVASQFGISLDETVGTLSAFANAGLIGETAGTDLRQLLLKLANPAADAAAAMKKYNIEIYDAQGNFVGLSSLAGQLQKNLGNVDGATRNAALATIFGSRAIAGANVLYEQGAKGIRGWTSNVDDSGFAAQQAAGKMNNLNGDAKKLSAAFQTDLIKSGSSVNGILRSVVQSVTYLVSAVGSVPTPVLAVGIVLGTLTAAVALSGGTALLAVPKYLALKNAMKELTISGGGLAKGIGLAGGAISVATLAVGFFVEQQAQAARTTSELKDSLDQATGATTKYTRAYVAKALAESGAFQAAKEAGVGQKQLTDAILDGGSALDKVNAKINANNTVVTFFSGVGIRAGNARDKIKELSDGVVQAKIDLEDEQKAGVKSADSTNSAADAYQSAADQAKDLADAVQNLTDEINKANGVGQDAVTANADYQKALADTADAVKTAKGGLAENTAAGSANVAMLADLAKKNEDAANAQLALDGNTDAYQATLKAGHDAIVANAIALGATSDQAEALASKIAAIPDQKAIQVLADTSQAATELDKFIKKYALNTLDVVARVTAPNTEIRRAGGGILPGSPSSRDNMLIHAASGEYVTNASSTAIRGNRAALDWMNSGNSISTWDGFARGLGSGGNSSSTSNVTNAPVFNISEVSDARGTAEATLRRLNMVRS